MGIAETCPKHRDGRKALELAKQACELSGWKQAYCLDTVAAAHAESGAFEAAVRWESKAIDLADDETEKDDYRKRLKLYEVKQPYRETNP